MNQPDFSVASPAQTRAIAASYAVGIDPEVVMTEERLPFTLRQVDTTIDLHKAVDLRHRAYARHLPEFAQALKVPESDDTEEGVVVLLAESKVDGSTLGTVRIQTNRTNRLNMEQSIDLPDWLNDKSIAEVRRLAVAPGTAGRLVKMVLLKAVYQYCAQNQLEWILVAARRPLDKTYENLTLEDILDGRTFIPLPREDNVPHRVLGVETQAIHDRLVLAKHPLLNFFCYTRHPDIHQSCFAASLSPTMAMQSNRLTAIQ